MASNDKLPLDPNKASLYDYCREINNLTGKMCCWPVPCCKHDVVEWIKSKQAEDEAKRKMFFEVMVKG
jgi:hypothetical protein